MRCPTLLAFAVVTLAALSDKGLTIRLSNQVVLAGQSTWLTCRVAPAAANRTLKYGIVGMQTAERQLDGDQAPIVWTAEFPRVPCGAGPAYCAVERQGGQPLHVLMALYVGDCGD